MRFVIGIDTHQLTNRERCHHEECIQEANLRQVVQQQVELMQRQAEEARRREDELTCHQNDLFEAFIQRFLVCQGEDREGPMVEQVEPEVRAQPP